MMLNAFYAALKGVDRQNVVVTGGTAPYGDLVPHGGPVLARTQPVTFWRELFCLRGRDLRARRCGQPAHFDVISHHPINVGRPRRSARNRNDASTPDLGRIRRVLRAAERSGRVRPKGRKPFWATEIWWNSDPPRPTGVPLDQHARWLAESFYLLWKQGVRTVVWFEIRDLVPGFLIPTTGLFLHDGAPKPAYQAFRFPFVADRLNKGSIRVWGKAPSPGPVSIELRRDGAWRTLKEISAGRNRIFLASIRLRRGGTLRARSGLEASLDWRLR
jgi:hypothetical protein